MAVYINEPSLIMQKCLQAQREKGPDQQTHAKMSSKFMQTIKLINPCPAE